jgi:hypothetical protein
MEINNLIEVIKKELLPNLKIESVKRNNPVVIKNQPTPWQLIGVGNYAAVFSHPNYPEKVVKIYAQGKEGFTEEKEVYQLLGSHPAYSECYYAEEPFLILKKLHGVTLYDCLSLGYRIPKQVIIDIDQALDYARSRGLRPHDVHGRNVMMHNGRGLVVDISDFLHLDSCYAWEHLKKSYYWFYRPFLSPLGLKIPLSLVNSIRLSYRFLKTINK